MLRNGLARQLIGNIPAYMGGEDIVPCIGEHKKLVQIIPVCGHLVDYRSDIWDFRPGFKYLNRSSLCIKFERANPEYKTYLKDFTAQMLDSYRWKVTTASGVISLMISVLNSAMENSEYGLFVLLDADDLIRSVDATQLNMASRRALLSFLMSFCEFIQETRAIVLPVNLDEIGRRMIYLGDKASCNIQRRHHKNIPEDYFQAIIDTANRVMRDDRQPFNMRMTAGIILLDSQIGVRLSEILVLERDCVFDYTCGDGVTRHYVVYNSIKAAKADVEVVKVKTICTELFYDTWTYMVDLREACEYKDKTEFMYIMNYMPHSHLDKEGVFPISNGSFTYAYKRFFGKYLKAYALKEWRGIRKIAVPNFNDGAIYSIPTVHSFRVHFATSLYRQGFPLDFIESIMSHTPQSNTYDAYYDVDDEEFRRAQMEKFNNKPHIFSNPDDEFDSFIDTLDD